MSPNKMWACTQEGGGGRTEGAGQRWEPIHVGGWMKWARLSATFCVPLSTLRGDETQLLNQRVQLELYAAGRAWTSTED